MRDSNFLQDALRAAATEPLDTCTLCGAIINRRYEDAHNHFHHADYQPFATATPGAAAVTCKLCGILINRSYWDTQPRSRVGRWPSPPPVLRRRSSPKGDPMLTLRSILHPTRIVSAHCDIPCGIYDPEQARIEAESCYKIIGMYQASDDANLKARIIHVKEERAELVKHHLDVLWHDYFKPEHLQQYPDLHETFWKATKQASTVRHSLDLDAARELLSMIDTIDEMWKGTGGLEKTRVNGRPC